MVSPSAVMLFKQKAAPKKVVDKKVRGKVVPTKQAKKPAKKVVAKKAKSAPQKKAKKAAPAPKKQPYKPAEWNILKQAFSLAQVGGAKGNVRRPGGDAGYGFFSGEGLKGFGIDSFGRND